MRKRLWQIHSWCGLIAGLALLVIGLTGTVLVFHEELSALFSPAKYRVSPTSTAAAAQPVANPSNRPAVSAPNRLPLDALLRHAERQLPNHEVTGWLVQNDRPRSADHLYVIRRGTNVWLTATLDPYTGQLLSEPHHYHETLRGWLVDLHSEFMGGEMGLAITAVFAVLLCALGVSGVWLYREFWKHVFTLRWRRGARILFSDLHKFTGICSVGFNLIFGFTGAYWNLTHTFDHVTGREVEQPVIERRLYPDTLSLDAVVADAARRLPGFQANFISLPSVPASPSIILWGAVEPRPTLASPYGSTLSYDPATGAHVATSDLRTAGAWQRITDTFEALHFGNFAGLGVKTIWALAGLTPGILAVTGFCIWQLRRRRANEPMPVPFKRPAPSLP